VHDIHSEQSKVRGKILVWTIRLSETREIRLVIPIDRYYSKLLHANKFFNLVINPIVLA